MHNGAFNTLEEVIKFYAKGGGRGEPNPQRGHRRQDRQVRHHRRRGGRPGRVPEGADRHVAAARAAGERAERAAGRGSEDQADAGRAIADWYAQPRPLARAAAPRAMPSAVVAARPAAPLTGFSDGNLTGTAHARCLADGRRLAAQWPAPVRGWAPTASPPRSPCGRASQFKRPSNVARPVIACVIEPGVYRQTVVIDIDGITLAGINRHGERPVLDGGGTLADAVQGSGGDLVIEGLTIRNYEGNGIMVSKASNVTFRNLVIEDTGLYGVYPVECTGVLVESCTVSGIRDAGIYVGSSRDIVVRNNEVFNNVAGIEIENCVGAVVTNNSAHHNTTGILVFVLPNNPIKEGSDTRVINNRVWANNHENFGKPGTTVSNLPNGRGHPGDGRRPHRSDAEPH